MVAPAFAAGAAGAAGAAVAAGAARSTFAGGVDPRTAGANIAEAVTNGRLLLPAKTGTLLSDSMRTAISAPPRLRPSARIPPARRPPAAKPTPAAGPPA